MSFVKLYTRSLMTYKKLCKVYSCYYWLLLAIRQFWYGIVIVSKYVLPCTKIIFLLATIVQQLQHQDILCSQLGELLTACKVPRNYRHQLLSNNHASIVEDMLQILNINNILINDCHNCKSYCIVILGHIGSGFHQSQYHLGMCNLVDSQMYILGMDHCNLVDDPHMMHILCILVPQQYIVVLQGKITGGYYYCIH